MTSLNKKTNAYVAAAGAGGDTKYGQKKSLKYAENILRRIKSRHGEAAAKKAQDKAFNTYGLNERIMNSSDVEEKKKHHVDMVKYHIQKSISSRDPKLSKKHMNAARIHAKAKEAFDTSSAGAGVYSKKADEITGGLREKTN